MIRINEVGRIQDIGYEIKSDELPIEEYEALCPGFINTHCHLELSHLKGKVPMHGGLHQFIPSLQSQRDMSEARILEAIEEWDQRMRAQGIVAVGDISNSHHSLACKKNSEIYYHSFIELFGLRSHKAEEIINNGLTLRAKFIEAGESSSLVPHSPYSVSESLFELIRKNEKVGPFSIHNQESEGEILMFEKGEGPLKKMLTDFGNEESSLVQKGESSLNYSLPYLDPKINLLLVHNTFTSRKDIEDAEERHPNLYWCFCPNANWYIEKKLPNIPLFMELGVNCTLGTDSLASNHNLSILSEMQLIQENYPDIKTQELIKWACKNGAMFLELSNKGVFKEGAQPGINEIKGLEDEGKLTKDSAISRVF